MTNTTYVLTYGTYTDRYPIYASNRLNEIRKYMAEIVDDGLYVRQAPDFEDCITISDIEDIDIYIEYFVKNDCNEDTPYFYIAKVKNIPEMTLKEKMDAYNLW